MENFVRPVEKTQSPHELVKLVDYSGIGRDMVRPGILHVRNDQSLVAGRIRPINDHPDSVKLSTLLHRHEGRVAVIGPEARAGRTICVQDKVAQTANDVGIEALMAAGLIVDADLFRRWQDFVAYDLTRQGTWGNANGIRVYQGAVLKFLAGQGENAAHYQEWPGAVENGLGMDVPFLVIDPDVFHMRELTRADVLHFNPHCGFQDTWSEF